MILLYSLRYIYKYVIHISEIQTKKIISNKFNLQVNFLSICINIYQN